MGSESNTTAVAFAIDALREAMGLSIPDLAHRAGLDARQLWLIVNQGAELTAGVAARLCMELAFVLTASDAEAEFVA